MSHLFDVKYKFCIAISTGYTAICGKKIKQFILIYDLKINIKDIFPNNKYFEKYNFNNCFC